MPRRAIYPLLTLLLALLSIGAVHAAPQAATSVPPGFTDTLVTSVDAPTAMAFVSPTRMLITSQLGQLWVYQNNALISTPALDLTLGDKVCTNSERGLLGVAVDPDFASNHFIYLYYTHKKFGVCPLGDPTNPQVPVNRVARFVLSDANVASGEVVLIDNIPSPNGNHNGGDLHFGADGLLYISVGDGGSDYAGDSGGGGANDATRDRFILLGKILRITRDGAIPASNPFQGAGTARCNSAGRSAPGTICQETFAWGLRNPFRFAFRPGTSQFYINDVGQNAWEEIDLGQAGVDYGWNCREGTHPNSTSGKCNPTPPNLVAPIYDYDHSSCGSITGGAFVPDGVWPADYTGTYLFADYVCGKIFVLKNQSGSFSATSFATNMGVNSATSLTFGPYNGTQALYYTTYAGNGQIRRIVSTSSLNRAPVAALSANPTFGSAPLSVSFSAASSSDPDGDPLSYDWNFGDGTAHASGVAAVHQYTNGIYTATLTVSDGKGGTATATQRIDSGNTPPTPVITAPAADLRFRVGQSITLQGSATDAQDGTLSSTQLSWRVLLHHNTHTHPYAGPAAGASLSITAPPPEDLAATTTSYLEVQLTATDSTGLSQVITRELRPNLVNITFDTLPAGRQLLVNDTLMTAPQTVVSWEGYELHIVSPAQRDAAGNWIVVTGWSDGAVATPAQRTITTPASTATYTATFGPAQVFFLPRITQP